MPKLNCRVGDLAIVVNAQLPQNLGQIVEVIGLPSNVPFPLPGPGHVWLVRTVSGRDALYYRFEKTGRVVRHAEGPVPDCRLRALPGLDPCQEIERSLGAEHPTSAPDGIDATATEVAP